jgi:starch synthase
MAKKRPPAPESQPSSKAAPRKAPKPVSAKADKSTEALRAKGEKSTEAPRAKEEKPPKRPLKVAAKPARPRSRAPRPAPLDIVMVASEMHPFATSGGLSEVVSALSSTLGRLGHTVTVILPRYRRVAVSPAIATDNPTPHRADPGPDATVAFEMGPRQQTVNFYRRSVSDRVSVVFVDAPELFDRDELYGEDGRDYPDNAYRFAVFSRAALEYVRLRGVRPSVIHLHDWQAGLLPAYQKMLFSGDPIVGGVPAVFTIHNLAFQGLFPVDTLSQIGLPWNVLHVEAMEYHGRISYLKSGINFSERITTVSPAYAREVLTPAMGCGFEGILARRSNDLVGILNGIDTDRWNPATDAFVTAHYSADDLSGKRAAKRQLLESTGLDVSEPGLRRPLIGLVSRLTDQKGFDLVAAAIDELMALDAAWVMLGSGERRYEQLWSRLPERLPGRVSTTIGYDHGLEHLIEAGADAFLMPSRFEPCGLNQLNSLRYGTLPIVRATGGLSDTVTDASAKAGNGFTFTDYSPEALVRTVRRALEAYKTPKTWERLQRNAMKKDYSWDVPALEYVKVYSANS